MKKISEIIPGAYFIFCTLACHAAEKFDILPDLPEPLATAQAASVNTIETTNQLTSQSIGQEPSMLSVTLTLIFVILLIYATGIIYAKLNKMGVHTFKKQIGDAAASKVSVVSTTPLGGNKTLHIVELDGKRMLLGASSTSIQLLKDLGSYPPNEIEKTEFSNIEIPNIRIPKIEIPKIEFPNIGFTKAFTNIKPTEEHSEPNEVVEQQNSDDFEISDIYEEGPDGIIDKLFQGINNTEANINEGIIKPEDTINAEHKVDPEEFTLYKKYL